MRTLIKILIALAVLVLIGILVYSRYFQDDKAASAAVGTQPSATAPQYPVTPPTQAAADDEDEGLPDDAADDAADEPPPPPQPPALAESDAPAAAALEDVFSGDLLAAVLRPKELIRHIVVTVDNLDRTPIPMRFWPIEGVAGEFKVDGGSQFITTSKQNLKRYDRHVRTFTEADPKQLVDAYRFFYPLFQQAYEDLGYPDGYFNDRLIAVIDHLLKAPTPQAPVSLVQPSVFYKYKDDALERNASWGQKTLIRMGPAHAKAVKVQLRRLREQLVAATE